jgi:hypothetical protein
MRLSVVLLFSRKGNQKPVRVFGFRSLGKAQTPPGGGIPGVSRSETPQNQNRRPAGGRLQWFHKFFASQKTYSPETAWMPFLGSARDRSGNTGGPEGAEELERIARFFAEQKMRPYSHKTDGIGLIKIPALSAMGAFGL